MKDKKSELEIEKQNLTLSERFYNENEGNFLLPKDRDIEDGCYMYDDYSEAFELYKKGHPVATIIDCDDGKLWIQNGWHFVNRVGYFVFEEAPEILTDDYCILY